jgi:hypothetical protein
MGQNGPFTPTSPQPRFTTRREFRSPQNAQAKAEPKEAKNLSKENSNKNEFSAQILADLGSAEESKRKAVIFSLFLFDLRLNLRPENQ